MKQTPMIKFENIFASVVLIDRGIETVVKNKKLDNLSIFFLTYLNVWVNVKINVANSKKHIIIWV